MKKKFLFSGLALIVALSGLTMVACDNSDSTTNPYEEYQTTITTFKESTSLFKNGVTDGIESDFYLNNFNYMVESDEVESEEQAFEKVEGSRYYFTLTAYGLNFIEDYYVYLSGRTGDDYSDLNEKIDQLNASYARINQSSMDMENDEGISDKHVQAYNSHFAMYEANAKDFINDIYSTALSLSDFMIEQVGFIDSLGTETQNDLQERFYIDSQILKVFDDIRRLIIVSAEGINYQNSGLEIFDDAVSLLTNYAHLSAQNIGDLSPETMADVMKLGTLVEGERIVTRQALANFSIYDFVEDNMQIEVYELENQDARAYYIQMQKYFSNNYNYLTLYYNNLSQNIF